MLGKREQLMNEKIDEAIQRTDDAPNRFSCCGNLFHEFVFEDLTNAKPPKRKGVYVVRVKSRTTEAPEAIVGKARKLVSSLRWELVEDYVMSRIGRLVRIGSCSVIYIGSAGTQRGSKNTLKHRHAELSSRHTAMYPIWALLCAGWKLEYGWKICENPSFEEKRVKERYGNLHQGKTPALVEK
jgi:hypothetical protein